LGGTLENTWNKYIIAAHEDMVNNKDTRELGKIRAAAAEYLAKDWINKNTKISVVLGTEGIHKDKNGSGFDLFCEQNNTRIQVKYRGDTFHLETTRRNSDKNIGNASKTGHVAYSVDECDIFFFVVPNYESANPEDSEFIAIPSSSLEDKKNPGFCVPRVSKKVIKEFKIKTVEVLENTKRPQ
jgi:hypothetical protein